MTLRTTVEKGTPSGRKKRAGSRRLTFFLGILICIPSLLLSATEGSSTGKTTEVAAGYRG